MTFKALRFRGKKFRDEGTTVWGAICDSCRGLVNGEEMEDVKIWESKSEKNKFKVCQNCYKLMSVDNEVLDKIKFVV